MRRRNIVAAVVLIICGIAYGCLAWALPVRSLPNTPGPSFFPLVVTAFLLFLSAALLIQALAADHEPSSLQGERIASPPDWRPPATLLLTILAYIVALPFLGFVLATLPFFATLMVLFGQRQPLLIAGGSLAMTVVLYVLFRHGFGVYLPRGLLAGIVS
jgi:putative tricarboxylic transport membrane protein